MRWRLLSIDNNKSAKTQPKGHIQIRVCHRLEKERVILFVLIDKSFKLLSTQSLVWNYLKLYDNVMQTMPL